MGFIHFSLVILFFAFSVVASDHIDGPITSSHSAADITDLFVFQSPQDSEALVFVMNTNPIAKKGAHFEDRLRYIFRVRKVDTKNSLLNAGAEEITITCRFIDPHLPSNRILCENQNGLLIEGKINAPESTGGYKLWAGLRSDPFFFNADWAKKTSTAGEIPDPKNSNAMDKINCLSLVLEVKKEKLFPSLASDEVLAVVGEIRSKESSEAPLVLLDRVGRPEITNVSLVAHEVQADLRDDYNNQNSFDLLGTKKADYQQRLFENITYYDNLDKVEDWALEDQEKVSEALVNDYLLVSTDDSCVQTDFLGIEKNKLFANGNKEIRSCGGRSLTDDIMDEIFGLYITGGKAPIKDGVDKPYKNPSTTFPYLRKPDLSISARLKAWVAREILL